MSTLWHYIGYIQIPKEKKQIEIINSRKAEYRLRKAAPAIEEVDDEGTNDADDQNDHIVYDDERYNEEPESKSDDEVFENSLIDQSKF